MGFDRRRPRFLNAARASRAMLLFLLLPAFSLLALPAEGEAQGVDLVLNVTSAPNPVPAGGTVTYAVSVMNDGIGTVATGVMLEVEVPAGASYRGFDGAEIGCSGMTVEEEGPGTLLCALPDLASLDSVNFEVLLRIATAGSWEVPFRVDSNEPDSQISNNEVIAGTTVLNGADLSIGFSGPVTGAAGSIVEYSLVVENAGPDEAESFEVHNPLPVGFELTAPLPAGCTLSGIDVRCLRTTPLAAGGSAEFGPFVGRLTSGSGRPGASPVRSSSGITSTSSSPQGIRETSPTFSRSRTTSPPSIGSGTRTSWPSRTDGAAP